MSKFFVATAPDTTCRQINARDEVELRRWPCYDDAYVPPDGGGNNSVITYLKRGQTVTYNNTGSQQTSVCGKPPMEGVEPMCWIAVKTATGQEGFIPAAQGDFADAFCNPKPTTYAESLVIQPCGASLEVLGQYMLGVVLVGWCMLLAKCTDACHAVCGERHHQHHVACDVWQGSLSALPMANQR